METVNKKRVILHTHTHTHTKKKEKKSDLRSNGKATGSITNPENMEGVFPRL